MQFPNPSPSEYAINTAVVVLTLTVLQYTGWLSDDPAGIDPVLLAVVAVTFPVFTYLLAVLGANVRWIPE